MDSDHRPPACTVCGLPLEKWCTGAEADREIEDLTDWWGDIILLSDPEDEIGRLVPGMSYENICGIERPARDLNPQSRDREARGNIRVHKGVWKTETEFNRLEASGEIVKVRVGRDDAYKETVDEHLHIPIHATCFELANKLFGSPSEFRHSYLRDIRGLYLAMRWRAGMYWQNEDYVDRMPPNYDIGREGYHACIHDCGILKAANSAMGIDPDMPGPSKGSKPITRDVSGPDMVDVATPYGQSLTWNSQLFAVNPFEIKGLTQTLLKNLQETPIKPKTGFADRFFNLPAELRVLVVEQIRPRDLPHNNTDVLPQSFWRDLLIHGTLPWLWDLDEAKIMAKDQEPCPSAREGFFEWDWQMLFRQLSRGVRFGIRSDAPKGAPADENWWESFVDDMGLREKGCNYEAVELWQSTGYHNDLRYVPPGLHHRRRVWQLLEEMFVGDVVDDYDPNFIRYDPSEEYILRKQQTTLKTFWDKSGKLLPRGQPVYPINSYGYRKKLNGEVYLEYGKMSSQHWQKLPTFPYAPPHPASGREMQRVMESRGYPVDVSQGDGERISCRLSSFPRPEYCPACSD